MSSPRSFAHRPPVGYVTGENALSHIPPDLLASVVAFLRDWLPAEAKRTYRAMIAEDPDHWYRHPHFAGGIITDHALRGNGINEKVLGVENLEAVWPALLELALQQNGEIR
jgi:hypothetical protein